MSARWLALIGLGCAAESPDLAPRDPQWWEEGDPTPLEDLAPADTGGFDKTGEIIAVSWGRLQLAEGVLVGGKVGMRAEDPVAAETWCELAFAVQSPLSIVGCEPCLSAWAFTRGPAEVLEDRDEACAGRDWESLANLEVELGWDESTLYLRQEGAWVEAGEARQDQGWLLYEIEVDK